MLSYESCLALRDAGFPQVAPADGHVVKYDVGHEEFGPRHSHLQRTGQGATKFAGQPIPLDPDEIRCPNTDELLAAIEARWLQLYCNLSMWWHDGTDGEYWMASPYFQKGGMFIVDMAYGCGPTLDHALAQLYLELASLAQRDPEQATTPGGEHE